LGYLSESIGIVSAKHGSEWLLFGVCWGLKALHTWSLGFAWWPGGLRARPWGRGRTWCSGGIEWDGLKLEMIRRGVGQKIERGAAEARTRLESTVLMYVFDKT
jgi:hypothetical protein